MNTEILISQHERLTHLAIKIGNYQKAVEGYTELISLPKSDKRLLYYDSGEVESKLAQSKSQLERTKNLYLKYVCELTSAAYKEIVEVRELKAA